MLLHIKCKLLKLINELPGLDKTEEMQLKEFEQLNHENKLVTNQLEDKIKEANKFLNNVNDLQLKVVINSLIE